MMAVPLVLLAAFFPDRPEILDSATACRHLDRADVHVRIDEPQGWREFRTRVAGSQILNDTPHYASLQRDGQMWTVLDPQRPGVLLYQDPTMVTHYMGPDLRFVGLGALVYEAGLSPSLSPNGTAFRCNESEGITTITCTEPEAAFATYVFDANQGNSLVRVERRNPNEIIVIEIMNNLYEGTWFPQSVTMFVNGNWAATVTVLSAAFTDLPSVFGPESLNVGPGTNVMTVEANGHRMLKAHNGVDVVPIHQVAALLRSVPAEDRGRPYAFLPMQFTPPSP